MPTTRRGHDTTQATAKRRSSFDKAMEIPMAAKKRILESNTLNCDMTISIPVITSKIPSLSDFKASKRKSNNTMDHDTTFDSEASPLAMLTDTSDLEDGVSSNSTAPLIALETPAELSPSPSATTSYSSDTPVTASPVKQRSALEERRAKRLAAETEKHQESPPVSTPAKQISALEARRSEKVAGTEATAATPRSLSQDQETLAAKPMSALEARRAKKMAAAAETEPEQLGHEQKATPATAQPTVQSAVKPMSALEARRAKRLAAAAVAASEGTVVTADTNDQNSIPGSHDITAATIGPDRLPTKIYNSFSPPPQSSSPQPVVYSDIEKDGDTEDENDDGFATPYDQSELDDMEDRDTAKTTPTAALVEEKKEQASEKNRLKDANRLLDPSSVSTYSSDNVIAFEHNGETCFCIGFEKGQQLVFIGYALIGAIFGSVDIGGATISSPINHPDEPTTTTTTVPFFPVFSPRTSALMVVRSIPHEPSSTTSSFDSTFSDLATVLEPFKSKWATFESAVVVKSLEWCGADQLEMILPTFRNLFRLGNKHAYKLNDGDFYKPMVGFQPVVKTTPEVRAFKHEPSWVEGIDQVMDYEEAHAAPSVSMICGTKNAGKSSFARFMVNRLLKCHQRVAYLETDVGQSEFTPSGLVSLHIVDTPLLGPPFTRPNLECKRSFYIGSNSPKNDPIYYQNCIFELIKVYREEAMNWMGDEDEDSSLYRYLPLVVNTHGWVKGLGYDLLFLLMEDVAPTHVFGFGDYAASGYSMPPDFEERTMAVLLMQQHHRVDYPRRLIRLDKAAIPTLALTSTSHSRQRQQRPTTMADKYPAADLRQLMFISYMYQDAHAFGTRTEDQRSWWRTNLRLVERIPWTIDWRHHLKGIWVLFDDVPSSQLLYALNGSVVGLVGDIHTDEGDAPAPLPIEQQQLNETIPPRYYSPMTTAPPNPTTTTCYGLGIIRSIDADSHQIHLLTPVPLNQLRQVTKLVKGDSDLPITCLFDQQGGSRNSICGIPKRNVPYISQDVINTVGSSASTIRRNLMRRSQQT